VKKKVIVIVHMDLVPPENPSKIDRYQSAWITEYDVIETLKKSYEVEVIGLYDSIDPLISSIQKSKPHFVFNLLEELHGNSQMDYHVVALLESLQIKYTGCNSKGLMLAKDKALSKKILKYHHIGTANFFTLPRHKKRKLPKTIKYPLIVKCLYEEASLGIAQASIVHTQEKLFERVDYIHNKLEQDALIEEFIEGKEFYVGVIGHKQLKTLPIWELKYENVDHPEKEIYSERAKWNEKYRKKKGIEAGPAEISKSLEDKIIKTCKKVYQVLQLSGYARIDLRITSQEQIYVLEANPNPNIASDDEFALSAKHAGLTYDELIDLLVK
jgi:D-alanine-D-alanine ligase